MSRNRRRDRKKDKDKGKDKAPTWITTFSDLMSLLLTFFILLYSMSTVDAEKFKQMSISLQGVLSNLGHTSIVEPVVDDNGPDDEILDFDDIDNLTDIDEKILAMYDMVSEYVSEEGLDAKVSVDMDKRGVFVDIKEAILFDSGSARIKESGHEVLKKIEGLVNNFDNDLVIEGHTDNVPSTTELYPSNWELSTARAVSVLRYLSEEESVEPRRLTATGYGEHSPIESNDTRENRAANRRVNILIIFDEESSDIDAY